MEFIRKALAQFQDHFKTLSTSQKLLMLVLTVVICFALFQLLMWTAKPDLTPLLDQAFSSEELARIEEQLSSMNVTYEVAGDRVLVASTDRRRIIARLQLADALPADTSEGWRKWVSETDMFVPAEERKRRWQYARQEELAGVIQWMDDVHRATVKINPGSKRVLSAGPSGDPSASVYLKMRRGKTPSKKLVVAVAGLVAGAVDRLTRDRVFVVADGVPCRVPREDSPFSGDLIDRVREAENYVAEKIRLVLGIPNVLVGVYVDLQTERIDTEEKKYGDVQPSTEKTIDRTSEHLDNGGQPGVQPNTGVELPGTGTAGEKSIERETYTELEGNRDLTTVVKKSIPGVVKSIRATVNVPRSYFERVFRETTGSDAKPTAKELEPIIAAQVTSIRDKVMPLINTTDPDQVQVSDFYDTPTMAQMGDIGMSSEQRAGAGQLGQYAKPAGLVVLALSSLLMVLLMLRRASSTVVAPTSDQSGSVADVPSVFGPDRDTVGGETAGTEGVLQGIEIDEDAIRARHMAEQVAALVKEDPQSAAGLVKQWIVSDE